MSVFQTKKINIETLGEYLRDTREALKLSFNQVRRLTQIPEKYLLSLEAGDYQKLPGDVYIKGFLKSLAAVYHVPAAALLTQFEKERDLERSLTKDPLHPYPAKTYQLPSFTVTPKTITVSLVLVLAAASVIYLIWQVRSVSAPPNLNLLFPSENVTVNSRSILLRGKTERGSRVYVNGQEVLVEESGEFKEVLNLVDGSNQLLVEAKNKFDKVSAVERTVVVTETLPPTSTPLIIGHNIVVVSVIGPQQAWLNVIADGVVVFEGILKPGSRQTFFAQRQMLISSGNAGSTRLIYNGRDLGVLGFQGEVLNDIRFTAE